MAVQFILVFQAAAFEVIRKFLFHMQGQGLALHDNHIPKFRAIPLENGCCVTWLSRPISELGSLIVMWGRVVILPILKLEAVILGTGETHRFDHPRLTQALIKKKDWQSSVCEQMLPAERTTY